jgi:alkylated DNA repair dioxygenase AlkB
MARGMAFDQLALFGAERRLPEGLVYREGVISDDEEARLLRHIRELPFRDFQFQGFLGKRRVISFGWRYDFDDRTLRRAQEIPEFLHPARDAAAALAGLTPDTLPHALVTEYAVGAGIGWHRDKSEFQDVIGISLASACPFRLRRKRGERWERVTLELEPRSAYLLRGPSRTEWEHSIAPVDTLRYSITFRSLR